jgi:hypothetical protein
LYQIEILHRLQKDGPLTFERLFETKANRGVMIGLFLALLELIREGLIWAKQPKRAAPIYLKALTDEPAEQAVQRAILAAAEVESATPAETQQPKQPPIAITELPTKTKPAAPAEEYEKIEPAENNKQKNT